MIEKLTAEKLREYGFTKDHINQILNDAVYESNCKYVTGEFFISKSEMKIYSNKERFEKTGTPIAFPINNIDLLPDYFGQSLAAYLSEKQKVSGTNYDKRDEKAYTTDFLEKEKQINSNAINYQNDLINTNINLKQTVLTANRNLLLDQYMKYRNELNNPERLYAAAVNYLQQDEKSNDEDNVIKRTIEANLWPIGKECFINDKDYEMFVDLLTKFFEGKEYTLPKKPIALKDRSKTKCAPIFNAIWREMPYQNKGNTLTKDLKYFEIIRVINHFRQLTDPELYRDITRKSK